MFVYIYIYTRARAHTKTEIVYVAKSLAKRKNNTVGPKGEKANGRWNFTLIGSKTLCAR